jgi:cytochrome c peroxidase
MLSRAILRTSFRPVVQASRRTMSAFSSATSRSNLVPLLFASAAGASAIAFSAYQLDCACQHACDAARKDIAEAIQKDDETRNDGTSIAGTLIRLGWHASGTFSCTDNTGGSNGATMRFSPESDWGANAGLKKARDFLEPIKAKYPKLSYADLWTLAAVVAIEKMGGPKIPWRSGRVDSDKPTTVPDGRLPAADNGGTQQDLAHIRAVFGRLGFTDREMVCLLGAHAVGRCHTDASGYWGPWTNAETVFSNDYFRVLLNEKWTPKTTHLGKVCR